ncbi:hypothetical protein EVAR_54786_1 [Eumeta japonica]|uniref:Uncharacterized protein n=1 Tax=Eumeta variegata TaxID=151549 RepID=A0A4C1YEL6_EUMVA|nr:hypothetical protein EVAR_54786_1 [Eumeta japonica]
MLASVMRRSQQPPATGPAWSADALVIEFRSVTPSRPLTGHSEVTVSIAIPSGVRRGARYPPNAFEKPAAMPRRDAKRRGAVKLRCSPRTNNRAVGARGKKQKRQLFT